MLATLATVITIILIYSGVIEDKDLTPEVKQCKFIKNICNNNIM